jgi:hypothetical protein
MRQRGGEVGATGIEFKYINIINMLRVSLWATLIFKREIKCVQTKRLSRALSIES